MECFKHCLMGHTSRSMEDLNYGSLTQDVSEEKNISMLPSNYSCDILVKNVAAFCPCQIRLPEAKVRVLDKLLWQRKYQNNLI